MTNNKQKSSLRRLIWSTLTLGTSSVVAMPYNYMNDMRQNHAQQNMDSMTPVEKFLYNQAVVHTFDTVESCSRKCPRQCIMQEVADLMMPRYICPSKGTLTTGELTPLSSNSIRGDRALAEDILPFSSQYLLILVPLSMLVIVILLIIWCRKCSNNNSSLD